MAEAEAILSSASGCASGGSDCEKESTLNEVAEYRKLCDHYSRGCSFVVSYYSLLCVL